VQFDRKSPKNLVPKEESKNKDKQANISSVRIENNEL